MRVFRRTKNMSTAWPESQISLSEDSSENASKSVPSAKPDNLALNLLNGQDTDLTPDQGKLSSPIKDSHSNDEVDAKSKKQSEDLWKNAYDALKLRDPELVAVYERYLASADSHDTSTFSSLSPEHIGAIIKSQLEDHKAKQLIVRLGSESIKVREQYDKILKFILWSNNSVSAAVSAQPYAALAWSGVSILLPLLLKSSQQSSVMIGGLGFISDLLRLYSYKESIYLQNENLPAHPNLVKAIEELYTDIFEYQVRLSCHLSRKTFKRGVRSTLELDDWKGMLGKIKNSDDQRNRYDELFSKEMQDQLNTKVSSYNEQPNDAQKRIYDEFELSRKCAQQERQDNKEAELLQNLASDYKSDKDSISARIPGTCEWFLKDDRFLKWRDSRFSRLLWASAGPGCGKSVLSRALIDEKRVCTNAMASTICYFFFKDGQEQRTCGADALCAILHQLFENTTLVSHALSSHKSYGKKLRSMFSELWELLVKSANDPEAGEIICILDALDECEEDARNQLINKLVDFFSQKQQNEKPSFTLKFLVTSRPYDYLEHKFQQLSGVSTYIRLDGDEKSQIIGREIDLVIDAKIPDIAGDFNDVDRKCISDRLKMMNNRTYLWLFLTIYIIERSRSNFSKISNIDTLLSDLPSKISDAYERILAKSSNKILARILLQLIVATTRPLNLEEVNIALTLATQKECCASQRTLISELWPSQSFRSTVQNMCGLFVSVHDGKISLIHQTAREFLVRTTESRFNNFNKWQGCFDMATAHGIMFKTCLIYLNFDEFLNSSQKADDGGDDENNDDENFLNEYENLSWPNRNRVRKYLFLHYASLNWATHYVSQNSEFARNSHKAAQSLCKISTVEKSSIWFEIYCDSQNFISGEWTSLGIASWFGMTYVVESFLNEGEHVNEKFDSYGNALRAASFAGHGRTVEMLLNKGADVNTQHGYHGNALQAAAKKGHENVISILLNNGADVNARGGNEGNALNAASFNGHIKSVKILLEKGADVNAQVGDNNNALQMASLTGHENIVQVLLKKGVDVNAQGGHYGNALQAASFHIHENIMQILLNEGADVNAQGGFYGNALQAALSSSGDENTVLILLNKGADVNAQGGYYGNALQAASARGHENLVQLLLLKGANINAQGGEEYSSALQAASSNGHHQIVQLLLNRGANVNAQGGKYGNALQAASSRGHENIVQSLINYGANVNAQGGKYGNVLQAAILMNHENVVQMLLKKGVDVNAQGEYFGNALHTASMEGYGNIVQILLNEEADVNAQGGYYGNALQAASRENFEGILLNHGVDVNAQGGYYGNALQAASGRGCEKNMQILLENGADVNAQGGEYGSALQAAAIKDRKKIVKSLLNKGADVNASGGYFGNALQAASRENCEDIVQMLLDQGADVNSQGGYYGNALQAASYGGHEKLVQILLEKGANASARRGEYGSALQAASGSGHEKVVRILLDRGVDINAQGGKYGNALYSASWHGNDQIAQLLHDRGAR